MQQIVRYTPEGTSSEIELSPQIIRDVISTDKNVTDQEVTLFLELCKAQKLNPFTREAYLIKYGGKPATIVVGKDVFIKRASRNPRYQGFKAGVFIRTYNGEYKQREGSMYFAAAGEILLGGWAEVYVDGFVVPITAKIALDEYSTGKSMWRSPEQGGKPGTMIRKVALCQALRDAFPEDLGGLYDAVEMERAEPVEQVEDAVIEDVMTTIEPSYIEADPNAEDIIF